MTDLDKDPKKNEEPPKDNPSGYETKKEEPKADDGLDDFGYEKPKEEKKDDGKESKESKETKKTDEKEEVKKVDPVSGYEKPPEKANEKAPPSKEEPKKEDETKDELELKDTGELLAEEINAIKEFAKKHKVSKEVAQGLVESKKQEIAKLKAAMADHEQKKVQEKLKVQNKWYEELKSDGDFGGEKFDFNVKRVDKVIQDFLPNLKKMLTDTKGMLPPYIMKDLAKLGDHLYSSENLVNGEPTKDDKGSKEKEHDPLAFYNS